MKVQVVLTVEVDPIAYSALSSAEYEHVQDIGDDIGERVADIVAESFHAGRAAASDSIDVLPAIRARVSGMTQRQYERLLDAWADSH